MMFTPELLAKLPPTPFPPGFWMPGMPKVYRAILHGRLGPDAWHEVLGRCLDAFAGG